MVQINNSENTTPQSGSNEIDELIDRNESSSSQSENEALNNNHEVLISYLSGEVSECSSRIDKLEKVQKPEKKYFEAAKFNITLSNIVLLILPLIQIIATIIIISSLDIELLQYRNYLNTALGIIGLGTIAELIFVPKKLIRMDSRLKDLEKQN